MQPLKKHIISKSTYIRGLQCHKSLYLNKYHKELKDEITDQQRAIFSRGNEVGILAQKLFPGGVDMTPQHFYNFIPSIQKTQKAIQDGKEIIYEAAFQYDGILALMDILVKKKDKWYAYEVKSSSSVKGVYIEDASLQYYVITQSGLILDDISIIHLNSKYQKKDKLDIHQLFECKSILKDVREKQEEVKKELLNQKYILADKRVPKVAIGMHCTTPYPCDFKGYCWSHIPEKSIFDLNRGGNKIWELFESGVTSIKNIPKDFDVSLTQQIQINAEQTGEEYIDKVAIKKFIEQFHFPLYFLDFETIMPAIPLFENTKPYQQLAFQYSIHKQSKTGTVSHYEYLAEAKQKDPREGLIKKMVSDIGNEGTILVYNKSFEDRCLKEMAIDFPQYAKEIKGIRNRLLDLAIPFEKKQYYTEYMRGKHSIKYVLPALVPELSYQNLEIQEGATASFTFLDMMRGKDISEIEIKRKNLLEYCKLDTYAMVKIVEKLNKVV